MRYDLPPLPGLHAFEATARLGSFVAASAELHLSAAAVSQRIRLVERHLGFRLFERLPRSLRLTEMGEAYLPVVRDALDALSIGTSGLAGPAGPQTLTIRVGVSYGIEWLTPRLADFANAWPELSVRVVSTLWASPGSAMDVDLDVVFAIDGQVPAGAELLGNERAVVITHPGSSWPGLSAAGLSRPGPSGAGSSGAGPSGAGSSGAGSSGAGLSGAGSSGAGSSGPGLERIGLQELVGSPRIQVIGFEDLWGRLFAASPTVSVVHKPRVAVDTSSAALAMVATTPGWFAIVPARYAARAISRGDVAQVVGETVEMAQRHWFVYGTDGAGLDPAVRVFADWLRETHLG